MRESERFELGVRGANHYSQALKESQSFSSSKGQFQSLVRAEDQQWEDSVHGLLKHLTNGAMNTAEFALNVYQQVIEPGGFSGKHRHLSEEVVFILEGSGYDLHWDPVFSADEHYDWDWQTTPNRFEWTAGDFVYVPPNAIHQHFAGESSRVRLISATSQVVKTLMGTDGLVQLEKGSERLPEN
jgi:quercetin dioxygenase-like cupin family protein